MKNTIQRPGKSEVVLFHTHYDANDSFDQFLDVLFYREMKYFASDLLEKGLSPDEIQQAVSRAMLVGKTAGLNLRQHFTIVYTQYRGGLMKDCKLSKLGYAMVLLNASASSPMVANWQMQVLDHFFQSENDTLNH
ncbi:hypothetical protein [Flavilitoribacter nigricans]|uniref:Uncharacterized protein n=1 Tax=Flavilitoribacter nigricans (strain ATCC 23147 / DSM 23189 / NBRC 102662 / NCIMB 1420 / SS-2) TaxID=1122177 RepID=A0A2D0NCH8_FLAN2|nr:hypothetical protein [Flavilitoribacter nigricans]PHN06202.1 hypothetical protein CRP01_11510 [Flavilitoribacter nigricans DSM 23189 = NBRC 102662]